MEKVWATDFVVVNLTDGWEGQAASFDDAYAKMTDILADFPDHEVIVQATALRGVDN